jgi:hypothetical protein
MDKIFLFLALSIFPVTVLANEKCVFDHVLFTVPHSDYVTLKDFLSSSVAKNEVGIQWKPHEGDDKGFAIFEDHSYVEIWDESRQNPFGYQEGCRVSDLSSIFQYGKEYGKQPAVFKDFVTVGREGIGGSPQGGLFFIWEPKHVIDPNKSGIRQLLKVVPADTAGKLKSELISDFEKAGLHVEVSRNKKSAVITDLAEVRRVVVASPAILGNGLVAIRFSRTGTETKSIPIAKNENGSVKMSLELGDKFGTLVFRSDQYLTYGHLLK